VTEEPLEDLYYHFIKVAAELTGAGYDAMEISAVMTKVALQIYKTKLSDVDYNKMVDYISQSRNEIEPFTFDVPLQ